MTSAISPWKDGWPGGAGRGRVALVTAKADRPQGSEPLNCPRSKFSHPFPITFRITMPFLRLPPGLASSHATALTCHRPARRTPHLPRPGGPGSTGTSLSKVP